VKDPGARIAQAYLDACTAELHALKPGNVHVHAAGHGMTVRDFELSARVSAPAMGDAGLSVGARIHEAIRRTHDAVGCNTNLGIVLLCAPLAAAAFAAGTTGDLKSALHDVLASLGVEDAEQAFAAIRLAAPAGLGDSAEHDVRAAATVTLLAAMRAARARDRIAAQYATDYDDVFTIGVPRLERGIARWNDLHRAASSAYLGFLSAFPDSHIVRKHGDSAALDVQMLAQECDAMLSAVGVAAPAHAGLLDLDTELKARGCNPGTSADLTVASLFVLRLRAQVNRPH
jgi:triphosphoribosyl-dephospho-CoA synthase